MNRNDLVRVRHMYDATQEAITFAQNSTRETLSRDRLLTLALIKSIGIIGEAAARITKESYNQYPGIPWSNIIAMRNRLIHGYFDTDLNRVWDTITDDLPRRLAVLEKILSLETDR